MPKRALLRRRVAQAASGRLWRAGGRGAEISYAARKSTTESAFHRGPWRPLPS